MAATAPNPLILDNAGLRIGDGATPTEALTELACVVNHLELTPDVAVTTLTTMCGERDYPGVVKWSLIATLYQSFDPDATEDVLSAAVAAGAPVGFESRRLPRSRSCPDTNPMWSGQVIPQALQPDQRRRRRRLDRRARMESVVGRADSRASSRSPDGAQARSRSTSTA
jgi:hypothetical protein